MSFWFNTRQTIFIFFQFAICWKFCHLLNHGYLCEWSYDRPSGSPSRATPWVDIAFFAVRRVFCTASSACTGSCSIQPVVHGQQVIRTKFASDSLNERRDENKTISDCLTKRSETISNRFVSSIEFIALWCSKSVHDCFGPKFGAELIAIARTGFLRLNAVASDRIFALDCDCFWRVCAWFRGNIHNDSRQFPGPVVWDMIVEDEI